MISASSEIQTLFELLDYTRCMPVRLPAARARQRKRMRVPRRCKSCYLNQLQGAGPCDFWTLYGYRMHRRDVHGEKQRGMGKRWQ